MSPLPTLAKMLFSIHRTVWLYFNIVLGRWGLRKFNNIQYKMTCHWVWVLFYVVAFILKVMLHKAIFNVDFYCVALEIYNGVITGWLFMQHFAAATCCMVLKVLQKPSSLPKVTMFHKSVTLYIVLTGCKKFLWTDNMFCSVFSRKWFCHHIVYICL